MKGLALGQRATITRVFTAEDVAAYRRLSGESGLRFGAGAPGDRPVVPGPLLGGLFSCLLGTRLPGRGTGWLKQQLRFTRPAFIGEAITATVEVIRLRPEKDLVNLRTICLNQAGAIICDGEALVLVRNLEWEPQSEVPMEEPR